MSTTTRAILALAIVLATAAGARAQAGWDTTPDTLSAPQSTGGSIGAPRVDVDAAGNAVALWTEPGPTPAGTGSTVRTARFDAASRRWSSPQTLSGTTRSATSIDVAVDAAGNALALWRSNPISVSVVLGAARYDATTGQWSDVLITSQSFISVAAMAMSDDGDAVVCWVDALDGLSCRRYSAATAMWVAAERLGGPAVILDVTLDAAGNIHVVSAGLGVVQTARFDAVTSTWGAVGDLATGLPGPGQPGAQIAMNEAGDAVATWSRGTVLEAARYPAGAAGWTAATSLSADGLFNEAARAAVDPAGVITVAWVHTTTAARTIQVSRYDPMAAAWTPANDLPGQGTSAYGPTGIDVDPLGNVHVVWSQSLTSPGIRLLAARYAVSTGQWTTVTNLSVLGQAAFNSDVAIDRIGNVMAVWFQQASGVSAPQALRWEAAPAAPAVSGVTPANTTLTVRFALVSGTDPALVPTTIDYSLDGGTNWLTRTPAGIGSPLIVTGLTDGVVYNLRLRANNSAGAGTPSGTYAVRSGLEANPSGLRVVSLVGSALTLAWSEPAGLVPTGYVLEGGVAPGQTLASVPLGAATLTTLTAPAGVFYLRVVGVVDAQRSGTSNEIRVVVGVADPPSSPAALLGLVNGSDLTLSWTNTLSGGAPTNLVLHVSGPVTGSAPLPVGESFSFANVPPGSYTFSVVATNAAGTSAPSAPVTLTFPGACTGAPLAPAAFNASHAGNVMTLAWEPPHTGPAVSGYMVTVAGALNGSAPVSGRLLSAAVGPGSYLVSVAATNACGSGPVTPIQAVVVP